MGEEMSVTASPGWSRLLDLVLTVLALALADILRPRLGIGLPIGGGSGVDPAVYALVLLVWGGTFESTRIYASPIQRGRAHRVRKLLQAILVATALTAGALFLSFRELSRVLFIYFAILDVVLLLGWRAVHSNCMGRGKAARRLLVVGTGPLAQDVASTLRRLAAGSVEVIGFVGDGDSTTEPTVSTFGGVAEAVERYRSTDVVIALPAEWHERTLETALELQRLPVNVWLVPDIRNLCFTQATVESVGGVPLLNLRVPAIDGFERGVKRALDLVGASALLVAALPLLGIISLLVLLDSGRPVLFKQKRVGENCRTFTILKFRTMYQDSSRVPPLPTGLHKVRNDPRVTRVGRLLRTTSLDELPQLFNVLRGDMSLVGPRPELPQMVRHYDRWQYRRFTVPQGLTGWWQINGRSDRPLHLHTEDDLFYVRNYSFWLDLRILYRTVGTILTRRGAY
jgi:exopolysaccharide biosynthesis polyprenyl glycosylphosphotransferase